MFSGGVSSRVLLAMVAGAPAGVGATIIVSPGQSVQTAINGAADGDVMELQPGTFNESIDLLGKSIHLMGVGGPDVTILSDLAPAPAW